MSMKTAGYLLFAGACLITAGVLAMRAMSQGPEDPMAQIMAAKSNAAATGTGPTQGNATLIAVTQPSTPQAPAAPAITDATAAVRAWLAAPGKADRDAFSSLVEKRPWAMKSVDISARPIKTPLEVRRTPIAARPTSRPATTIAGLPEVPPFAMETNPQLPSPTVLPTGRGYAAETFTATTPLLRVPLILRPKPETLPPQGEPILNDKATATLPPLPPMRTTPAAAVRASESGNRAKDVQGEVQADNDPPAGTRSLLPREKLR